MNKRLAAHQSRKGLSVVEPDAAGKTHQPASSRAAQAAARVAARYAQTPSYSEMQAAEARAALRAAEVATRAALEAQAAAQAALDNLAEEHRMLAEEECARNCNEGPASAASNPVAEAEPPQLAMPFQIRWEPDMLAFYDPAEAAARATHQAAAPRPAATLPETMAEEGDRIIAVVEPAEPINANLIQFPRELVATRRLRPRLAETLADPSDDHPGQLSIFEVDPTTISTAPADPGLSLEEAFRGAVWSGIKLDSQLSVREEPDSAVRPVAGLHLAPFGLRLMAVMIDASLIVGLASAVGALLAGWLNHFPALRTAEFGAFALLLLTTTLYHLLFLMRIDGTPGMRYAHIALCTFDDANPSREQVRSRLVAMLLSVLPLGLGVAWALFDEDHLSWHDRISGTYLRAY